MLTDMRSKAFYSNRLCFRFSHFVYFQKVRGEIFCLVWFFFFILIGNQGWWCRIHCWLKSFSCTRSSPWSFSKNMEVIWDWSSIASLTLNTERVIDLYTRISTYWFLKEKKKTEIPQNRKIWRSKSSSHAWVWDMGSQVINIDYQCCPI